jgi:hypothetical protein
MARTGFERTPEGDAAPKVSGQRARQGQNIKGMLAVLIVGTLLVVGAYAIMLALSAKPAATVNESHEQAAATAPVQTPPEAPETAGSPD